MSRDRLKRRGSLTAAVKASAVSWPIPGMLISRRHASDTLTTRLMSASITTMAASTSGTRPDQTSHGGGQSGDAVTRLGCLTEEGRIERARQPNTEHHRKTTDLVLESNPLPDQLLASDDQGPDG